MTPDPACGSAGGDRADHSPDHSPDYSRMVARIRRRYPDELSLLPPGWPRHPQLQATYDALRARGLDCGAALRVLRQLVMERLVVLDTRGGELAEVVACVTELAEFALDAACLDIRQRLDVQHGAPRTPDGQVARLWIVGMGKFGARELNVSSDIDLIYVHDHDGDTDGDADGRGRIGNHEYFARVVRGIQSLIGEVTEHGFVFRVDLALRPNGNSGPPTVSLAALEEYFQVQGREWERFAWLKSRVVAPRALRADGSAQALRAVVMPFVFRRYLDYGVFDALRDLHRQIREHAQKRCAGRPDRANDVKLSRGGIREIEFTVQLLQVVRGGRFPELRTRPTLDALARVSAAGLMPADTARDLAAAYAFLRRVEHRIQYLDDQQTHVLPTRDDDLAWIARTMGYAEVCPFLADLDTHRERVAEEFDRLLGGVKECRGCHGGAPKAVGFDDLDTRLLPRLAERVRAWRDHPRVQALRDDVRARLLRLIDRTGEWIRDGEAGEDAALRMIDWMEPLLRRDSYLALLVEQPQVHLRLLRMLGAARWPARYLMQHPGVIDELASGGMLAERFDPQAFATEVRNRRAALAASGEDDDESLLNLLRRAHHAEQFRTLARDVDGRLAVEQVADDLSALADTVLAITAEWCWQRLKTRHRETPRFAVIGYGKLGGKELGYGSDLDIVFVYDDDERAGDVYAAFVRKMINWLTVKTGEGDLFEIDTALRPNGNSGLLVTRFEAFEQYQQQRGSNTAWTWEHQAITRARFVIGAPDLAPRFDAVRRAVLTAPRDAQALAGEIATMRDRVRGAHRVPAGRFDVKHSPGGMVDAEFAVQYLVLAHAGACPALLDNVGNIALLQRAEAAGLLPAGVGRRAADAYRALRAMQHRARLDERATHWPEDELAAEAEAIATLWRTVFGAVA